MSPEALNSFFALFVGFAVAGALNSGFQALMEKPPGFGLLMQDATSKAFAAVPFLVFAGLIFWMYHVVAHRPGGQPIGALETGFAKIVKYVALWFRFGRKQLRHMA